MMELLTILVYGLIGILAGIGLFFILSIKTILKWQAAYEKE